MLRNVGDFSSEFLIEFFLNIGILAMKSRIHAWYNQKENERRARLFCMEICRY